MKNKVPEGGKYIMFPSLEKLDVNLIIKLNFDDVTKFFFFNEYIKAYLEEDEDLVDDVDDRYYDLPEDEEEIDESASVVPVKKKVLKPIPLSPIGRVVVAKCK